MRSTASIAARPRDLALQGAFTNQAYTAQTPIIWQHWFLSDKQMTNWSEGVPVFLTWAAGSKVAQKTGCAVAVANSAPSFTKERPVGALAGHRSPPA
jgi:hypothetical protein